MRFSYYRKKTCFNIGNMPKLMRYFNFNDVVFILYLTNKRSIVFVCGNFNGEDQLPCSTKFDISYETAGFVIQRTKKFSVAFRTSK